MAFATIEQLAEALEMRVTPQNALLLRQCLDAAAAEIQHALEDTPIVMPFGGLVVRTNVNRGVEWFKAAATYNGGVGYEQTGALTAPTSGFERHAAALLPLKTKWGVA